MTTTFQVSDVERYDPSTDKLYEIDIEVAYKNLRKQLGCGLFEAYGGPKKVIHTNQAHGLWAAVHTAFSDHVPLGLSPDHIWITIARTFAEHVVANAEELRKRFVDFDGKKKIEVVRNEFVKGSPDNDWQGAFAEFSDQIAANVGKARDLVVSKFSTTGPMEKAASEVVLMDAMQMYFEYSMRTCCGIPEVTLFGTTEDWADVMARTRVLGEYGLQEWVDGLLPVLGQFVRASAGNVDTDWWKSFYKYRSMSGGDTIDGHFVRFFRNTKPRPKWMKSADPWPEIYKKMSSDDISHCLSKVPFTWHYYATDYQMQFVAGVPFAAMQDGLVVPVASWAVGEAR